MRSPRLTRRCSWRPLAAADRQDVRWSNEKNPGTDGHCGDNRMNRSFRAVTLVAVIVATAALLVVTVNSLATAGPTHEQSGEWRVESSEAGRGYLFNTATGEVWLLQGKLKHEVKEYVPNQ